MFRDACACKLRRHPLSSWQSDVNCTLNNKKICHQPLPLLLLSIPYIPSLSRLKHLGTMLTSWALSRHHTHSALPIQSPQVVRLPHSSSPCAALATCVGRTRRRRTHTDTATFAHFRSPIFGRKGMPMPPYSPRQGSPLP